MAPTPLESLPVVDLGLVLVDMDGTLLDGEKAIPEGLWDLLPRLTARGVVFAPASGRQYWTLRDMFAPVAEGLTVIAENGSVVMRDGRMVSCAPLDLPTTVQVVRGVRSQAVSGVDTGLVLCGRESAYVERPDQRFLDQVAPYYHRTEVVDDLLGVISRMESGSLDDVVLKVAQFEFEDVSPFSDAVLGRFAETHQYVVSGRNWADLMAAGVDKGDAVADLQAHLGIGPERTVAFGDFHNDLGMLARADFSFAMANGHPDVIAAARFVAPPNTEAGVLTVLEHLLATMP